MPAKIIDQYTNLPLSRTKKWQLRHPERAKRIQLLAYHRYHSKLKRLGIKRAYPKSLMSKVKNREYMRERDGSVKRRLGCKSYQEQRELLKHDRQNQI